MGLTILLILLIVGCSAAPGQGEPIQIHPSLTPSYKATRPAVEPGTLAPAQKLRVINQSDIPLYNLVVVFPDARIEFGDVPGGATTEYRDVPQGVYRYAAYDVEVNGQKYQQPVVDWMGESPMNGKVFTYILDVDPLRWETEGQVIRLVKVSEDPGTGTVHPTTIPPTPGNPTLQPPAGPPSLLLEMFDGHSVDPAVQQPILSLYRLDANGNLYHLYTPPARARWGASGYDVSPDGQWLVFSEAVSAHLYKMRTDGSETVRLTNTPDSGIAPVWQADGKSILYVTYTGDRNEATLARIDASGKPLQTFPVSAPSMQNLRLSPDGQVLLFTAADLPSQVPLLFTVDLTTGKITRLGLEQGQGGIWSPDGQFAIFMGDPTQGQTMLYNRKDEKVSVLETSLELAGAVTVAWTLDGRSLVMEQGQGETREIWLWDLAAKSVKNLTPGARYPLHFLALVGDGSRMLLSASLNGPLAQLCELDIASGSIFPIIGLPELTMGVNLVAWRELPPMPASVDPFASNVRVAPEALPTRIPASDSEIWVTIQGSGEEVANVRSGPATTYPVVGTIGAGKGLQAMAISADHQWIQFRYPHTVSGIAWIYLALTDYRPEMGALPETETIFPTSAP